MKRDEAEVLALQALAWMVADPDLLGAFLGQSGLAPADLGRAAGDGGLLAGVMDFLAQEDARMLEAARALGVAPARLAEAGARLSGGVPHWT